MSRELAIGRTATAAALATMACGVLAVLLSGDVRAFGVVVVGAGILASWSIARKERATLKPDEPAKDLTKAA